MARKVAVTLPDELYDLIERARAVEHRSRSEVVQEALRTHVGEPVYHPTELERRQLGEGLDATDPASTLDWGDVRRQLCSRA